MKTCWIDVETTGLDPAKDRIIELAAIMEFANGETDEFHKYCLPFDARPESFDLIQKITGITWEYLEEVGVLDTDLYVQILMWLGKHIDKFNRMDKAVFAGYNAAFDKGFISELFKRNGDQYFGSWFSGGQLEVMTSVIIDTRISGGTLLRSMKLSAIAELHGIEFKAHSAIEDIKATMQIEKNIEFRLTLRDPDATGG